MFFSQQCRKIGLELEDLEWQMSLLQPGPTGNYIYPYLPSPRSFMRCAPNYALQAVTTASGGGVSTAVLSTACGYECVLKSDWADGCFEMTLPLHNLDPITTQFVP